MGGGGPVVAGTEFCSQVPVVWWSVRVVSGGLVVRLLGALLHMAWTAMPSLWMVLERWNWLCLDGCFRIVGFARMSRCA